MSLKPPVAHSKSGIILLLALTVALVFSACSKTDPPGNPDTLIRIGFMPGPYIDQFKRGIQPILEQQGYHVQVIVFNNSIQPNAALLKDDIEANVFQHKDYLTSYMEQNKAGLSELCSVPSAPLGMYSHAYHNLNELPAGARIALPNDPANLGRALVLLQQAGVVSIDTRIDPLAATEKDIIANPKQIQLVTMNAPYLPHALADTDFAVIPGSYALEGGMRLSESLLLEHPPKAYQLVVAIKTTDIGSRFARDLAAAYHSEAFKQFINIDEMEQGFAFPDDTNG